MTMCAAPPDDAMAAGEHLVWCKVAIFFCVPFLSEEWIFCGEVILSGDGKTSAAVGTACAAAGAGVHGGLPVMTLCAGPPDFFLAAVADGFRCEGKVSFAVPLAEKIGAVIALAKACQGFSHGLLPPFYVEPQRNQYSAAISEGARADFWLELLARTKFFAGDRVARSQLHKKCACSLRRTGAAKQGRHRKFYKKCRPFLSRSFSAKCFAIAGTRWYNILINAAHWLSLL